MVRVTGVTVVFDAVVAEKVPEVKLAVDWFVICVGIAIVIITSNVTVTEAPGARLPIDMPESGEAPAWKHLEPIHFREQRLYLLEADREGRCCSL